jgi:hypothetical protein
MVVSVAVQQCSHYRMMVAEDVFMRADNLEFGWLVVFSAQEDVVDFSDAAEFEEFDYSFCDGGQF